MTNAHKTRQRNQLERKFKNSRSYKQLRSNTNIWVKNISDKPLTEQQTPVLEKGLNYNTKDASKVDYVADLESALKSTGKPDETKENIRHQITTNLRNKRPVKLNNEEKKQSKIYKMTTKSSYYQLTKDE